MRRLPAAQRREQLLDTAAKIFADLGYGGATTSELAKAAGVTEPIIYRHFASKRDLFIALVDRTGEETIRLWQKHLSDAPDPAERLRRLIGANPMVTTKGASIYRVMVQAMMEIHDEQILAALKRHLSALHQFVQAELVRAQEIGQVSKRFSPDLTAWLLLHLGLGYGVLSPMGIPGHGVNRAGMHVRDVIEELLLDVK